MQKNKNKKSEIEIMPVEETVSQEVQLDSIQTEIDLARKELEETKLMIAQVKKDLESAPAKIEEKNISVSTPDSTNAEKIAAQKAYDNQKVTGKFMNRRAPGQMAKLAYIKYADDPVKWWEFFDGGTYTIPRGFADQINEHYHTPVFIKKSDSEMIYDGALGDNSSIADVDTSNKKYAFVPIGFH